MRPSPVMLSLVLTGLVTLSKTPETVSGGRQGEPHWQPGAGAVGGSFHKKATVCFVQARKLTVLLPDVLETLTDANADVKTKALVLFINMMGHMKREEANLISLRLAEELLPLFDDVRLPWEPEPRQWLQDGCPSVRPCGKHLGRDPPPCSSCIAFWGSSRPRSSSGVFQVSGAVEPELKVWLAAPVFRIQPRSSSSPISHANPPAPRGQGAELPLSSSLPGVQTAAGGLHPPLQRCDEDCGGEKQEKNGENSAECPAPTVLPYERPDRERGQGAVTSDWCRGEGRADTTGVGWV